jgi:hypothetical protein
MSSGYALRSLLTSLALVAACLAADVRAGEVRILVQSSPLAGFQYHAGAEAWPAMAVGDPLILIREPENRYDSRAVRVEWRGRMLGYLPRKENRAVAAAMDAGERVAGRIARLSEHRDPWQRVLIEVFVVL